MMIVVRVINASGREFFHELIRPEILKDVRSTSHSEQLIPPELLFSINNTDFLLLLMFFKALLVQ